MPITTEVLSIRFGGKPTPQSIRSALCRNGHWCGLRPAKLPSGQLAWPDDAIERLTSGDNGSLAKGGM
jgi:hypothetical protein